MSSAAGGELDADQARAARTGAPRVLVLAGAGSGKTRCLVARVAHLVVERGVAPERVLLATFTQRAAREMKRRAEAQIGREARALRAGTFHALALAAVRRHAAALGLDPGFSILARDERRELLGGALAESGLDPRGRPGVTPDRFERLLGRAENDERPLGDLLLEHAPELAVHEAALEAAAETYAREKAKLHTLDFDDLLVMWRALLDPERDTARRLTSELDHVLVDEYQDTTSIQASLAEDLAERAHLFVVGDDAQAIYGFRGARFDNILEFPTRAPTEVHRLVTSYRSAPPVIALARAALEMNPLQFPKPLASALEGGPPVELIVARDETDEARAIARRAAQLAASGEAPLEAQAVLVRRHRDAEPLDLAFAELGVPLRLRAGRRFTDRAHVAGALAYLRLLARPSDLLAWRRILALWPGMGPVTVGRVAGALAEAAARAPGPPSALLAADSVRAVAPSRAKTSVDRLVALLERLESAPGSPAVLALLLDEDEGRLPLLADDPADALADLERLRELDIEDPGEAALALGLEDEAPSDAPRGVWVGTIHAAKGLEWLAVFVPGLADGRFPSGPSLREREGEAEERRLFYVAVTRAARRLILSRPASTRTERGLAPLDPSRFLAELPPELYSELGPSTRT